MENVLLQPLLKAGLLDIGDKDERLEDIEKAIADLQAKLKGDYSLLLRYTLVALDPNISDGEQVLIDTESIVTTYWKALRGRFADRPIQILRAVILHALYNTGISDAEIARIVYLTASNFYPYAKLGREKDVVERVIAELGDLAEEKATEEWSLVDEESDLKLSTLKIAGFKFESVNLNRENLKAELLTAIRNDPSGHSIGHGGNSQWGNHFAEKASEGIQKALTEGFQEFGKSLSPALIEAPINKFFSEFKKTLDQTLKNSFNSIQAVERRSKLLWWKESLYSSSLKDSYRNVDIIIQPIVMAFDLYDQLPEIAPVSVDFLLRDTLLLLNSAAVEQRSFAELLQQIETAENKALLKDYFDDKEKPEGRISITDFIALVVHDKIPTSALKQYTGVEETEQVSLTDIAVIILHDSMAQYLIPKE